MKRRRDRLTVEEESNFWPAVADVFIGFLALVLVAGLAAYTDATSNGQTPPPAKQDFQKEFERAFAKARGIAGIAPMEKPKVDNQGFSELNIYFPAAFLFLPCHAELLNPKAP